MRVTFNTSFRNAAEDIARAAEELALRQREVASGRRVSTPSDDPAAAQGAVAERAEMAALDQYVRATDSVESRLTVVDTVLSDLLRQMTDAKVAVMGARGSTVSTAQKEEVANQLMGIRDGVFTAVATQYRGTYLFSGQATLTAPYQRTGGVVSAYQGTSATMAVDVDRQTTVDVTFDADALLRGGDVRDLFGSLEDLAAAVQAGDQTAVDTGLAALDRAFDRVTRQQSRLGNDLTALVDQRGRLDALRDAAAARLGGHEDTNMAEAISDMTRAETAYRAALGAAATGGRLSLLDFLR